MFFLLAYAAKWLAIPTRTNGYRAAGVDQGMGKRGHGG